MAGAFSSNARRPSPGSLLHRWLAARERHPSEFDCGIRVLDGRVDGERSRWRYARSAADQLIDNGVVTLTHGKTVLRLRFDAEPVGTESPGVGKEAHTVLAAREVGSGARVLVSVDPGALADLGID